jgi:hypothetical protein
MNKLALLKKLSPKSKSKEFSNDGNDAHANKVILSADEKKQETTFSTFLLSPSKLAMKLARKNCEPRKATTQQIIHNENAAVAVGKSVAEEPMTVNKLIHRLSPKSNAPKEVNVVSSHDTTQVNKEKPTKFLPGPSKLKFQVASNTGENTLITWRDKLKQRIAQVINIRIPSGSIVVHAGPAPKPLKRLAFLRNAVKIRRPLIVQTRMHHILSKMAKPMALKTKLPPSIVKPAKVFTKMLTRAGTMIGSSMETLRKMERAVKVFMLSKKPMDGYAIYSPQNESQESTRYCVRITFIRGPDRRIKRFTP